MVRWASPNRFGTNTLITQPTGTTPSISLVGSITVIGTDGAFEGEAKFILMFSIDHHLACFNSFPICTKDN